MINKVQDVVLTSQVDTTRNFNINLSSFYPKASFKGKRFYSKALKEVCLWKFMPNQGLLCIVY